MIELSIMRPLAFFVRWGLLLTLLTLSVAARPEAAADWTVRPTRSDPGRPHRCVLESERQPVFDAYQTTWAQIVVDDKAVRVSSASILDGGDRDIGIVVDEGRFSPAEEVVDQRTALFAAQYRPLLEEFKRGRRVRVQLRFWPTWPKTGTHSATFSLIGFTRAHTGMSVLARPRCGAGCGW
jgi:hypothetical protein